jgi:hypothetical protein
VTLVVALRTWPGGSRALTHTAFLLRLSARGGGYPAIQTPRSPLVFALQRILDARFSSPISIGVDSGRLSRAAVIARARLRKCRRSLRETSPHLVYHADTWKPGQAS